MTAAAASQIDSEPASRFVFGGVAFDIFAEPGLRARLSTRAREVCVPFDSSVTAHVALSLARAPELSGESRVLDWSWKEQRATLRTASGRAELRALGPGQFAGTALVGSSSTALDALVLATVGAIVERAGGLVLHAAGVELDGSVLLFIGPSGAGKSTAANQTRDARVFAHDRAVVFPTRAGWFASALPGGKPGDRPIEVRGPTPLGAVLRVVQGQRVQVRPLPPHSALVALRESCLTSSSASPVAALDRVQELSSHLDVREMHTVLGADLSAACRAVVAP